jgi:hypothetical protein
VERSFLFGRFSTNRLDAFGSPPQMPRANGAKTTGRLRFTANRDRGSPSTVTLRGSQALTTQCDLCQLPPSTVLDGGNLARARPFAAYLQSTSRTFSPAAPIHRTRSKYAKRCRIACETLAAAPRDYPLAILPTSERNPGSSNSNSNNNPAWPDRTTRVHHHPEPAIHEHFSNAEQPRLSQGRSFGRQQRREARDYHRCPAPCRPKRRPR